MTVLKELRAELAPAKVLVCMSGDFVGPSLTSSFSKGAHMIDAMNAVGVDYATFGNHEFDYGYQSLLNRLQAGMGRQLWPKLAGSYYAGDGRNPAPVGINETP